MPEQLVIEKGCMCGCCRHMIVGHEPISCSCGSKHCEKCSVTCSSCGGIHCTRCVTKIKDTYYGYELTLCKDCVVTCCNCQSVLPKHRIQQCACGAEKFCNACESVRKKCRRCGKYLCSSCTKTNQGCAYCCDCYAEHFDPFSAKPKRVLEHGYQPPTYPIFAHERDSSPTYGVEIELNFPQANQQQVFDIAYRYLKGRHIWKKDSSITLGDFPHGAELILAPHTINELKKVDFKKLFKEFEAVQVTGYESNNCGIHVHFSNKALIPSKAYALRHFLFGNRKFLLSFTKRTADQLEAWARIKEPDSAEWEGIKYSALNYRHDDTYEMRIFRSTTDAERFMGIIEFVDSLVYFTNNHSIVTLKKPDSLKYYFNYLKDNDRYQNLCRYLAKYHTSTWTNNS